MLGTLCSLKVAESTLRFWGPGAEEQKGSRKEPLFAHLRIYYSWFTNIHSAQGCIEDFESLPMDCFLLLLWGEN